MERLNETDERILAELTEHARATFAEIGQKVNLSAPAVKRRVDRMLDNGVIKGFTTVIDRNALGWNTEAFVQVFCHGTIAPDQLRAAWVDMPEVVSAATVTGTSDAILHVLARDMRHLETALERIRARFRNASILLDLENCAAGYSPTRWQRDLLPQDSRRAEARTHLLRLEMEVRLARNKVGAGLQSLGERGARLGHQFRRESERSLLEPQIAQLQSGKLTNDRCLRFFRLLLDHSDLRSQNPDRRKKM